MSRGRTGVLLFDEAAQLVKEPLAPYIRHSSFGYYLNCVSIDASGPLLLMVVEPNGAVDSMPQAEVQIQYSFVRLTVKSTSTNPLGFAPDNP